MNNSNQMSFSDFLSQGTEMDDGSIEMFLESVEGFIEPVKVVRNKHTFLEKDLFVIVANIMKINVLAWRDLVDGRGMRPVKAAIKLGAAANIAQLVGDLRLAVTAEDINTVYADDRCKSCMTGHRIGKFWEDNDVGVIYAPNFRLLVGLVTKGLNPHAYGFKGDKVMDLLEEHFNTKEFPVTSEYVWRTVNVAYKREIQEELKYSVISISLPRELDKVVPDYIEHLIHQGHKQNKESKMFFSYKTEHTMAFPSLDKYKMTIRKHLIPELCPDGFMPDRFFQEGEFVSNKPGYHYIGNEGSVYKMLFVEVVQKSVPLYRDEDQVIQSPVIRFNEEYNHPYIDFDDQVLSDKDAALKIKELGLILQERPKIGFNDIPF